MTTDTETTAPTTLPASYVHAQVDRFDANLAGVVRELRLMADRVENAGVARPIYEPRGDDKPDYLAAYAAVLIEITAGIGGCSLTKTLLPSAIDAHNAVRGRVL